MENHKFFTQKPCDKPAKHHTNHTRHETQKKIQNCKKKYQKQFCTPSEMAQWPKPILQGCEQLQSCSQKPGVDFVDSDPESVVAGFRFQAIQDVKVDWGNHPRAPVGGADDSALGTACHVAGRNEFGTPKSCGTNRFTQISPTQPPPRWSSWISALSS